MSYSALDKDQLFQWITGIDTTIFSTVDEMVDYFYVLVCVGGLVFWRTQENEHEYFKKRDDDKVTVTVIETSGATVNRFITWCSVNLAWLEANHAMSMTPQFNSIEFRDKVKGFIV